MSFGFDAFVVTIVIAIVFIIAVFIADAQTALYATFANVTAFNNPAYVIPGHPTALQSYYSIASNVYNFDIYLAFLFFILNIVVVVVAGLLNSHPLGYVVGFFLMFFFVFMAMLLSNTLHGVLANNAIISQTSKFPTMLNIVANLGLYNFIFLVLYLIAIAVRNVFFSPSKEGGGGQSYGTYG